MLIHPGEKSAYLDNLGIGYLTLREAACIVVKCLLCDGAIEIKEDVESVSLFDPKLEPLLESHISDFAQLLIAGINNGTLKTAMIMRNLDETIVIDETYLDACVLEEWLKERGIELGDLYDDYWDFESHLLYEAQKTIEAERIRRLNPDYRDQKPNDERDILILYDRIRELESQLSRKKDVPEKLLSTRERGTLLKLIIGMAVKGYGHNPSASRSPTAQQISDDLMLIGISIDSDTIRKWLREASEFLPPQDE